MGDLISSYSLLAKFPDGDDLQPFEVREIIRTEEAVDAVPVVHGRWISKSHGFWEVSECSECGVQYPTVGTGLNYCPNCGAKMDLEVE